MSGTYINQLIKPIKNWEEIPWKYFGYAYAGVFGSVLVLPLIYIGLIIMGFIQDKENTEFEKKELIRGAVHLSILIVLFFAIPFILMSTAAFFFVLGFYLDGYLLLGVSLLWITGLSVSMPAFYYLLPENGGWGWTQLWEIYSIGGLKNKDYRRLVGIIFTANILLFVGITLLILTGIGILLIPLLFVWYCYICADIYEETDNLSGLDDQTSEDNEETVE